MLRLPSIESLEARIAPALVTVNPLADILVGAAQKTSTIDLQQLVNDAVDHPNHTVVKFNLNFDLDPSTPGIQSDTDPFTAGVQPPQLAIELYDDLTPLTVQNFLRYVQNPNTAADYIGTFFHRAVKGFVLQGGGFNASTGAHIDTFATVHNEFSPERSNVRGTVAMAKVGDDPNSATSEWFVNLADNSQNLDNQNGGFTVFGEVVSGMEFVDQIVALLPATSNEGTPQQSTGLAAVNNLITVTGVTVERPTADPSFSPALKYEIVGIANDDANVVTGKLTGSSLKLSYTGNAGFADVTVKITNLADSNDFVLDTFRVTAEANLLSKIASDSFRGNLSSNFGIMIVPGEKGTVGVTISNNGGATYSGLIDLGVYLSKADGYSTSTRTPLGPDPKGLILDTVIDDIIGQLDDLQVSIASGASITLTLPVTVPEQLVSGFNAYRMIAEVVPADSSADLFADDNAALNGTYHGLVSEFGLVPTRALGVLLDSQASSVMTFAGILNAKLSVRTSDAGVATFSMSGPGTGRFALSSGGTDLLVSGTNSASILNLNSPDIIDFNSIDVSSTIGTVNLSSTTVAGYLTFSGGVRLLNLGDVDLADGRIVLGAFNTNNSVGATLNFGTVKNVSLESDQPITALNARQWLDPDGEFDRILAPALGKLNITGKASTGASDPGIAGDFEADVVVYGTKTVGSLAVKGQMRDAFVQANGHITSVTAGSMLNSGLSSFSLGGLTVKGAVADSRISAFTTLAKASVGSLATSEVLAKTITAFTSLGAVSQTNIEASANIGTLTLASLSSSSVAAAGITSLILSGDVTNSGVFAENTIGKISSGLISGSEIIATAITSLGARTGMTDSAVTTSGRIGTFSVAELSDSTVDTGGITRFAVRGAVAGSTVTATGNVGAVTVGAMFDSSFLVGTEARPEALTDFDAMLTIGSFTVTGVASSPSLFSDSQVAAATISKIIVKGVDSTGSTSEFGFVADKVGSYQRGALLLLNLSSPAVKDQLGQYSLTIL
jgi:cyclophilin family peptidyl-prolyl cis-trans isomerase